MTAEQKKLVEDNHWLIYAACKRYNIPVSDWYDVFALKLCEVASRYKKDTRDFAKYVTGAFRYAYYDELEKRAKHNHVVSLDESVVDSHEDNIENKILVKTLLENAWGYLTKREQIAIHRFINGLTQLNNSAFHMACEKIRKISDGMYVKKQRDYDKIKAQTIAMYRKGYPNKVISSTLNISQSYVSKACKGEKRETTATALSRLYGVDRSTVVKNIRSGTKTNGVWDITDCKIKRKPYPKYSKKWSEEEIGWLESGLSVKEIALRVGRTENSVRIKMHRTRKTNNRLNDISKI